MPYNIFSILILNSFLETYSSEPKKVFVVDFRRNDLRNSMIWI